MARALTEPPFALTARADQYMHKRRHLAETIQRAQEFHAAGADMVLVPGLTGREEIEPLCRSVDCPVAVMVGLSDYRPTLKACEALGVKRVIIGSSLARSIFPNSQLGGDTDLLSQLRSGALEFMTLSGLILSTYTPISSIYGIGYAFPNYTQV